MVELLTFPIIEKRKNRLFSPFSRGFTLIELMIVVAVIGILMIVAIPKFADLIRRANDARTMGGLGAIRSSVSIYYADTEGYPDWPDYLASLVPKYIEKIPTARTTWHDPSDLINNLP